MVPPRPTRRNTLRPIGVHLEKLNNIDQATANAVEGEIREFVRRDVSFLHRQRSEANAATTRPPKI